MAEERKRMLRWPLIGASLLLLFIVMAIPFLMGNSDSGSEELTTIQSIIDNPQTYVGRRVTLNGEIDSIEDDQAFIIDQEGTVFGDELPVISRQTLEAVGGGPGELLYKADDEIQVTGVVRRFEERQLEEELGVSIDGEKFASWIGKEVIIADNVQLRRED